jgi:WD40 repeat protein
VLNRENIASVAFAPQNNILAIGSADIVYLIDPATLKEYARIPHTGTVSSVSFSPDGLTLMTASLKVLQFWDVSKIAVIKTDNLIETACGRVLENFNEAQWSLLFGEEKFKLLCPYLPVAP